MIIKISTLTDPIFPSPFTTIIMLALPSNLYATLRRKQAKIWYTNKKIKLVDGTTRISVAIELVVKWNSGSVKTAFFVVEDNSKDIILGRPFLNYAKIGILPTGYFHINKPNKIFKFVAGHREKVQSFRASMAQKKEIYKEVKSKIVNDKDNQLHDMLIKYTKNGLFSEKIGTFKGVEAKITMKDNLPYRAALRPTNNQTKKIIDEELDKWLEQNIIAPVAPGEAKFISPIHIVKKKPNPGETTQNHRLVCDQRALNNRCVVEPPFNPPRTELIFSKMSQAKYFSKIDLRSAYLQVPIAKSCQGYFCFNTHRGIYKFLRTPFGFVNSGSLFNEIIERVLHGVDPECCANFYDDIYIFSKDLATHKLILEQVLQQLFDSGMTVNYKKLVVADTEVDALGFHISQGKIQPDSSKTECVKKWPTPKNRQDVAKFLGFANFFCKFINDFQLIATPLTQLLKKNFKFVWSMAANEAFEAIKSALISDSCILHLPNMEKEFLLFVDACKTGYGGCLTQLDENGNHRPVFFLSKKTTDAEKNYCVTELECAALVYCISKLQNYLQYTKFTVFTDHIALKNLLSMTSPNNRVKRWSLFLCGLSCKITYKPGKTHFVADALSRYAVLDDSAYADVCTPRNEIVGIQEIEIEGNLEFDNSINPPLKHACSKCADPEIVQKFNDQVQKSQKHQIGNPPLTNKNTNISTSENSTQTEIKERKTRLPKPKPRRTIPKKRRYTSNIIIPTKSEENMGRRLKSLFNQLVENNQNNIPQDDLSWKLAQDLDEDIVKLRDDITAGRKPKYSITAAGVVKYTADNKNLTVLPKHLRKSIFEICHNDPLSSHPGQHVTLMKISSHFVWKNMRKDVADYVKGCAVCQQIKSTNKPPYGFYNARIETQANKCLSIDCVGRLPRSAAQNEYIVVITCDFTRWVEFFSCRNTTTKVILDKLFDYCCRMGFPKVIKSDNATVFTSKLFADFCSRFNIRHVTINAYKARENPAERRIRDLKTKIKAYAMENHRTWDKNLAAIGFAIRSSQCETTKFTPAMLMLLRELHHPLLQNHQENLEISESEYVTQMIQRMKDARNIAIENVAEHRRKYAENFNSHRRGHNFKIGSVVWRKTNTLSNEQQGISSGVAKRKEGPFIISRILGKNSCLLETTDGKPAGKRHVEDLELFTGQPDWAL